MEIMMKHCWDIC